MQKVIIEGHSKLWHSGVEREERDTRRHERLSDLGYEIIYLGWSDATRYGTQSLERIRKALDRPILVRPTAI